MRRFVAFGLMALGATSACDYDKPPARIKGPAFELDYVRVEKTPATLGFAQGVLRRSETVEAFRVSRSPVTIGQFRECVKAGACGQPPAQSVCGTRGDKPLDGGNELNGEDNLPVTCVGAERAAEFCRWQGAELPTLAQWLVAARGPEPQRFAWRNGHDASCVEHPGGMPPAREAVPAPEADDRASSESLSDRASADAVLKAKGGKVAPGVPSAASEDPIASCNFGFAIGLRPQQASPSGVQDVLLTHAELLRTSGDALLPACGATNSACIVTGVTPASIEAVHPIASAESERVVPYGFRCVAAAEVAP